MLSALETVAQTRTVTQREVQTSPALRFEVEGGTLAPVWTGVIARLKFYDKVSFHAGTGELPKNYSDLIAQTAARPTNNPALEQLINQSLKDNQSWIVGMTYDVGQPQGLSFGVSWQHLTADGSSDLATIADAARTEVGNLRDILVGAGLSTEIFIKSEIDLAWATGHYTWALARHFHITGTLGVARILQAQETIRTGIEPVNRDEVGLLVLGKAEDELETTLKKNGISPLVGLSAQLTF